MKEKAVFEKKLLEAEAKLILLVGETNRINEVLAK
jgi:hypothetical protein